MKKLYLLFFLALLPMMASAWTEWTVEIDGLHYHFDQEAKTAEVTYGLDYDYDHNSGNVVIPKTVTYNNVKYTVISIGVNAFFNCSGLTSVTIPNSVTTIDYGAFWLCSNMVSLTIGNSVTLIADGAFSGCYNLASIKVASDNGIYDSRDKCNAIIETKTNTLILGCKNTVIPNSVTTIYKEAFAECKGLTSVTIPNSVTTVGDCAFQYCSDLTTITMGTGINYIGYCSFAYCSNLKDLYMYSNLPTWTTDCFKDSQVNAKLHVRAECLDICKTWSPWNCFKSVVKIKADVSLSESALFIEKGKTVTLKATVTPSTLLDKSVTWKSSNTKVATVTSSGKVKSIKAGTATITCTSDVSGQKATCKVTVGDIKLNESEMILQKGNTRTLTATVYPSSLTDKSVTWKSSNTSIATVTTAGKVKGIKAGTVTITCTSVATGAKATCKVTVANSTVSLDKSEAIIDKGKTLTLKVTVTPSTLEDKSVTWTSSNTAVATVSSSGKVKGVKSGTAIITCTSNATGVSATCHVTVGKVVVSISEVSIKKSRGVTLEATVYPSTLTEKSVIWESSDTEVATVSSSGRVKGIKAGTAIITCTSVATGLSGTCTVTVLSTSESRSLDGDDDNVTGIKNLDEALEPFDIYDLRGQKVRHQVTSLDGLPAGIYIVNGRKILKK